MYVIKDIRNNKVYIDDSSFIRNFEEILEEGISLKNAKEKYPTAQDLTKQKKY
jgi:hypothetical protein